MCFKTQQSENHWMSISNDELKKYQLKLNKRFQILEKFGNVMMK